MYQRNSTIRSLTQRDAPAVSPLTRHMLGLGILLLTVVPAYLVAQGQLEQQESDVMRIAREAAEAADSNVDVTEIVEIEAHIREVAVRYEIPPILVAAIVEAESEFNPRAVSRRGARGLMQLMPRTASSLQVSDTFDPYQNIEGGVRHLRGLMDRYRGNLPLVLAAYNAGEQAVTVYRGVPPYRETRRYVTRILRRIGRPDLIPPRYGGGGPGVVAVDNGGVVVAVSTATRLEPTVTHVAAAPTPVVATHTPVVAAHTPVVAAPTHVVAAPTHVVATATPATAPPRSARAERQFLERQLLERQAAPKAAPKVEQRTVPAPRSEPTASPWSTRNLGEAP